MHAARTTKYPCNTIGNLTPRGNVTLQRLPQGYPCTEEVSISIYPRLFFNSTSVQTLASNLYHTTTTRYRSNMAQPDSCAAWEADVEIIVMGVSGCGKSTLGEKLSVALRAKFSDADDFHTDEAVQKMSQGTPLTDDDRWPWLRRVGNYMASTSGGIVMACSALKRAYRDAIRAAFEDDDCVVFVYIQGSEHLFKSRINSRQDHFMPPDLLKDQLNTLEEPSCDECFIAVPADQSIEENVKLVVDFLEKIESET